MDSMRMKCGNCQGTGFVKSSIKYNEYTPCEHCLGKGTLDWIENVRGKYGFDSIWYIQPGRYKKDSYGFHCIGS